MTRPRRPLALLLVTAFALMTAAALVVAVRSKGPDRVSTSTSPFGDARDGVCEALEEAQAGRSLAARRVFVNRSHGPLHELAAATSGRDREVSARLLEAKQRVERDFEEGNDSLGADLAELGAAAGEAITVVGGPGRGAC